MMTGREIKRNFVAVFLLIFILSMLVAVFERCSAQGNLDSIKIDKPLAEKINYMAWKSRQLDSTVYYMNQVHLNELDHIRNLQLINLSLVSQVDDLKIATSNLALESSILTKENKDLKSLYTDKKNSLDDCSKKIVDLQQTNAKLKASKNRSVITNVVILGMLGITMYALATDKK